ncbi:hypothetical protein [Catenovulum maritimum]|uniref:Uncharacterized protein n=1 Tax=Catenovulum maritimum TaxID=1513271 RepID=A0A0J8GVH5_9ALTE|nr:hypothetical protein [Catenovulum maritimum]KMT66742.1 hypothetical protein XM47_01045 [Catenovulum maritimum]
MRLLSKYLFFICFSLIVLGDVQAQTYNEKFQSLVSDTKSAPIIDWNIEDEDQDKKYLPQKIYLYFITSQNRATNLYRFDSTLTIFLGNLIRAPPISSFA